jgi:hypothetical protein
LLRLRSSEDHALASQLRTLVVPPGLTSCFDQTHLLDLVRIVFMGFAHRTETYRGDPQSPGARAKADASLPDRTARTARRLPAPLTIGSSRHGAECRFSQSVAPFQSASLSFLARYCHRSRSPKRSRREKSGNNASARVGILPHSFTHSHTNGSGSSK